MTDRKLQHVIHSAHVSNVNAVIILSTQGGMVPTYVDDSLAEMVHLPGDSLIQGRGQLSKLTYPRRDWR